MLKRRVTLSAGCILLVAIAFGTDKTASASLIDPGFDLFRTLSPGTFVDLSGFGLGFIDLEGNPFGPGITDTIVQRIQGIDPFPFPGGLGTIDIELVALHLVSIDPIDLTPLGGPFVGVFADLHTTINKGGIIPGLPQPDLLMPSTGSMDIRHEFADGGTFDSSFNVFANAIFTIVGGDPGNPLDVFFSQPAPLVSLSSTNSTWSHTAPDGDLHNAMFPAGEFYVTGIDHDGPHNVEPAPAPGTLALLALGGLFARRRRR